MLSKVYSSAILGIDPYLVEIEVDAARGGLPAVVVVGLPDTAIRESKDRVASAIKNSCFDYPVRRITINLAPADIKKTGPYFDLPIALGILAATGQVNPGRLNDYVILGELALDGNIRPVKGVLPIALGLAAAKKQNIILPEDNSAEAAVVKDIKVYPVKTLAQTVSFLNEETLIPAYDLDVNAIFHKYSQYDLDFSDVKGQVHVKRALEVAVAGSHNIILIGPPGSGKTMLAKRIPAISPDMALEEALETTKIHSVTGLLPARQALIATRPFRSPHHTSSDIALTGGGTIPHPGEISLAHNGVLFLDELPEFHRNVLEVLRQPLEDGEITVSRAKKSLTYPSKFMLVGSMNPCPCGFYGDRKKECHCSPLQVQRYLSKISGPLLDRIDIHIDVPRLAYKELTRDMPSESSSTIKERVNKARAMQKKRFNGLNIFSNARMNHREIRKFCPIGEETKELLRRAIDELGISARAYDKILKVGRTIADISESETIQTDHISEAIQYRSLDRNLWA